MKPSMILTGCLSLCLVSYAAYAEDVTISTYYPAPYGSYQDFDTEGTTDLAKTSGDVLMATGGGDVGIGTAAPARKLDVNESSGAAVYLRLSNADTGTGAADGLDLGYDGTEMAYISNAENTPLRFDTNNTEQMRILANGNVGIGTTTPAAKLDVNGRIRLEDAAGNAGLLGVDCSTGTCYATYAP